MDDLAVDVSDHYPISINCDTDCEHRIDTDTKDGKVKINWEKVDKECYSEMVNQEITNRKVMEEAQKLESNNGIENMIIEISNILRDSAKKKCTPKKRQKKKLGNLQVWNNDISNAYKEMKQTNIKWCNAGKPKGNHPLVEHRKRCKQQFRRVYRTEIAMRDLCLKEKVMNIRTKDSKIFHMLINRQRQSIRGCIQDLHIDNEVMSGKQDIINGFRKHFSNLAVPIFDPDFNYKSSNITDYEIDIITELATQEDIPEPTYEEINTALSVMKKGKAAVVFELTVENILYGGDELLYIIHKIIVAISREGHIPDLLKRGLLTPIFKNKGSKLHVTNYRGITVSPLVCKIIESIMKNILRPKWDQQQCPLQRGYTKHSAPLNAAFILEEARREALDIGKRLTIVLLDAFYCQLLTLKYTKIY